MKNPATPSLSKSDLEFFENFWPNIEEAWNNGNREPYIAGHENSTLMVPHGETLSSPASIRSFTESLPECTVHFFGFDIMGNQGLVAVRADFSLEEPNGALMDKGKFVALFAMNSPGTWELTHAIWNSDLPAAAE